MAFARKGRRRLIVDKKAYLWGVSEVGWDSFPFTVSLFVFRDSGPDQKVQNLRYDIIYEPHLSITPSTVRLVIEYALANGWRAQLSEIPGLQIWK